MKKKLLALLLMFITLIPCTATNIDIRKEVTTHHGGARMPSRTLVTADYENGRVTLTVTGYTGNIQVYVSDSQGNVVGYSMSSIVNRGTVTLDLVALPEGSYSLSIALDNASYYGEFEV